MFFSIFFNFQGSPDRTQARSRRENQEGGLGTYSKRRFHHYEANFTVNHQSSKAFSQIKGDVFMTPYVKKVL